ncbi:MAG TPA: hypothetical protein VL688_11150 [Verrucomicrobiae bacterium]|nr:hypothetical protein [Verrucomicrobiae bacterium]
MPSDDAELTRPNVLEMTTEDMKQQVTSDDFQLPDAVAEDEAPRSAPDKMKAAPKGVTESQKAAALPPASVNAAPASGGGGGGSNVFRDLQVIRIQKQISEIIRANEKIKQARQAQIAQIEQITDQAKIHRKLLEEIQEKKKDAGEVKSEDVDEILRQEKMRLIGQETEKNKATVDSFDQGPSEESQDQEQPL